MFFFFCLCVLETVPAPISPSGLKSSSLFRCCQQVRKQQEDERFESSSAAAMTDAL